MPAKRNIEAVLDALERRMTMLEEARDQNPGSSREMSDAELVELVLVYHEIGQANGMTFAEALERLMGLAPDVAERIAGQLAPLAEERMRRI